MKILIRRSKEEEVVIASVARTPFGNFGGTLKDIKAVELGGFAIKESMERIELDPATVDEVIMGMVVPAGAGQVPGLSIKKILDKNKLTLDDIDLIEINEAFAAVPLVSGLKILGMDEKTLDGKVNVNGSAVAVGHPIGATGARILMTMIYELQRRGKKSGICAICSGMAQGGAVYIEIE